MANIKEDVQLGLWFTFFFGWIACFAGMCSNRWQAKLDLPTGEPGAHF